MRAMQNAGDEANRRRERAFAVKSARCCSRWRPIVSSWWASSAVSPSSCGGGGGSGGQECISRVWFGFFSQGRREESLGGGKVR